MNKDSNVIGNPVVTSENVVESSSKVVNNDQLLSQLIEENKKQEQSIKEQSTNLINQRDIINNFAEENKQLKTQIEELKQRMDQISNDSAKGFNSEELTSLRNEISSLKKAEQLRNARPLLDRISEVGVPQEQFKKVFEFARDNYSVDLTINPNMDILELTLNKMGFMNYQEPTMVPHGSFPLAATNNNYQNEAAEAAYQEKLAARRAQIQALKEKHTKQ